MKNIHVHVWEAASKFIKVRYASEGRAKNDVVCSHKSKNLWICPFKQIHFTLGRVKSEKGQRWLCHGPKRSLAWFSNHTLVQNSPPWSQNIEP